MKCNVGNHVFLGLIPVYKGPGQQFCIIFPCTPVLICIICDIYVYIYYVPNTCPFSCVCIHLVYDYICVCGFVCVCVH